MLGACPRWVEGPAVGLHLSTEQENPGGLKTPYFRQKSHPNKTASRDNVSPPDTQPPPSSQGLGSFEHGRAQCLPAALGGPIGRR